MLGEGHDRRRGAAGRCRGRADRRTGRAEAREHAGETLSALGQKWDLSPKFRFRRHFLTLAFEWARLARF